MCHDSRQAGSRRSPDSQTPASPDGRTDAGRAGGGSQKKAGARSLRCEATRRRMDDSTLQFFSVCRAKRSAASCCWAYTRVSMLYSTYLILAPPRPWALGGRPSRLGPEPGLGWREEDDHRQAAGTRVRICSRITSSGSNGNTRGAPRGNTGPKHEYLWMNFDHSIDANLVNTRKH